MSAYLQLGLFSLWEWNKQYSTFPLLWWAEVLMPDLGLIIGLITGLTKPWKNILGKMQKISCLVGLSNLYFSNSVSQGSQTDLSFTVSLFCHGSATRSASPSMQLQDTAESCSLLWPFLKLSSVFPLPQHYLRGSQPARSKTLLHLPWLVSSDCVCLLREFLSAASLFQWWWVS